MMNSIQKKCITIAQAFEEQRIEEGYAGIIEFTDLINATASIMSISLQTAIQQQLLVLQHYLALHDDVQVAQLFRCELCTLVHQVSHSIN